MLDLSTSPAVLVTGSLPLESLAALGRGEIVGPLALVEGEAPSGGLFGGGMGNLGMILLMLGVFYFIVLRPMKNQEKQRKERLGSLKKNDRIVLNNGIFGRISSLDDKVIMLEVADKVKIKVKRSEVADFEENALKDEADKKKDDSDKKKDEADKKKDGSDKNKDDSDKKKDEAGDDEAGGAKS